MLNNLASVKIIKIQSKSVKNVKKKLVKDEIEIDAVTNLATNGYIMWYSQLSE